MTKTHYFNNVEPTPGEFIAPATLTTDPNNVGDDTTGLSIYCSPSAPAGQILMQQIDKDGSTVTFELTETALSIYNRFVGCNTDVFSTQAGLNGTVSPVCVQLSDGARIWQGTGHPTTAFTGTGRVGDIYLRRDGSAGRADASCGTVSGTAVVTDTSIVAGDVGRSVSGTNIPAGAYIVSVSAGVSFTMSANATGTGTVTVTLTGNYYNVCVTAGTPGTWSGIA